MPSSHVPSNGLPSGADVLDVIPDGVVVVDPTGSVTAVNSAARKMLRVADGVGKQLGDVVALQDRAGNDWVSHVDLYDGSPLRSGIPEQSWYLADGTELLVTVRILRTRPHGATTGAVLCLRTSRARERLDRERSDLVATVAHELRSPLTGVKGFVATLLSKWDRLNDDQKKLMLATVNADADRLTRLIAELLDVARIDTGRLSLHPRLVDAVLVTDRVLDSVRAGSGREVLLDAEEDLPRVLADPDKVVQVVTNLVENAVRHGEGVVRVSLVRAEVAPGRPAVLMIVDDDGDGISPDIRSRVFTKFWKHGTRGGSGLGMYIVHGLVAAHGGSVEIGDSPTGGARISVLWPESGRSTD